jgi:MraZ protein
MIPVVSNRLIFKAFLGFFFFGFPRHMGLFLSTTVNRIDAKGRVSIPGPFRSALADHVFAGVILMKSPVHACLEGFAPAMMDDIAARLNQFALFSSEQDDLAAATLAECVKIGFDTEGRIVLPGEFAKYAGLKDDVAFVGLGNKFQMWTPSAWDKRRAEAQKAVRDKGLTLPKVAE